MKGKNYLICISSLISEWKWRKRPFCFINYCWCKYNHQEREDEQIVCAWTTMNDEDVRERWEMEEETETFVPVLFQLRGDQKNLPTIPCFRPRVGCRGNVAPHMPRTVQEWMWSKKPPFLLLFTFSSFFLNISPYSKPLSLSLLSSLFLSNVSHPLCLSSSPSSSLTPSLRFSPPRASSTPTS